MNNKTNDKIDICHTPRYPDESLFVTFYSFKGGVGRSCALANCAMALATAGRKVLAIDFDLEGPGLCRLLNKGLPTKGLVEFLTEFKKIIKDSKFPELNLNEAQVSDLSIRDFVSSIPISNEVENIKPGGRLDLLCAGYEDDTYPKRIDDLNIKALYDEGIGSATFQAFKEHIKKQGYHYVLIDARTGFSDTGLISIFGLADAFVFLCGLNEQNIIGTKFIIDDLKEDNRPYLVVASPVPEAEESLKLERLKIFNEKLGRDPDVILPYHPHLSLCEDLFFVKYPSATITLRYKRIASRIRDFADDTCRRYLQDASHKRNQKEYEEEIELLRKAGEIDSKRTVSVLNYLISDFKSAGIENIAEKYFALALQLSENNVDDILHVRSHFWEDRAENEYEKIKAMLLWEKAIEDIRKAISISPKSSGHIYCYGVYLTKIGVRTGKYEYFEKACVQLKKAIKLDDKEWKYFNVYGNALAESGKLKSDLTLLRMAQQQFIQALSINKNNPGLYSNLGLTTYYLYHYSRQKDTSLLEKAKKTILVAETLGEGEGSYGMACLQALEGDLKEALKWLKKALSKDPYLRGHALYYFDFKKLRKDPEFIKLTSGVLSKEKKDSSGVETKKEDSARKKSNSKKT